MQAAGSGGETAIPGTRQGDGRLAGAPLADARFAAALRFAVESQAELPLELTELIRDFNRGEGELGAVIGPLSRSGPSTGVVWWHGEPAAHWGQPDEPAVCFSLTKAFLCAVAGVALHDGLIAHLDEPVAQRVPGPLFESAHNASITWRHLLQLSSEWHGTLFGKPDSVDWHRVAGGPAAAGTPPKGSPRELQPPGTHWEYNDVRMNCLALALLQLFGRSLAEVLQERVMVPIGASGNWAWHGYQNSFVPVCGRQVQSVAAGAHWGGGMFVSAHDLARLGQLFLQQGLWQGQPVLPAGWVAECTTAGPLNPSYGLLWWLNRAGAFASLPRTSYWGGGLGGHLLWVDPEHELVVVTRWIDMARREAVLQQMVAAVRPTA